MSTVFMNKQKCACCGEINNVRVLGSTNAFGYSDLDFRPPEMKRSTMHLWVKECKKCGYVNHRLDEERENAERVVDSERYIDCDGIELHNRLAIRFVRLALIAEAQGNVPLDVISAYHRAAWACDDNGEVENAKLLRARAAEALEKYIETDDNDGLKLILCDLLRRSEQYDKVIEKFTDCKLENADLQRAIQFSVEKAREGDWDRYAFGPEGTFVSLPVPRGVEEDSDQELLDLIEDIRKKLELLGEDNDLF